MMSDLDPKALDRIFREARTHRAWLPKPVTDEELRAIYDLSRLPPTAANTNPGRVLFVRSPEAKEKLRPALDAGNVEKTMTAPVTAVLAYDLEFYEKIPKLFPIRPEMRDSFASKPEAALGLCIQNGNLHAAYFMLAARAVGLDIGPMGGFDARKVDELFFAGTPWRSLFLCNLGHGDPSKLHPRLPRLEFDEAAKIV